MVVLPTAVRHSFFLLEWVVMMTLRLVIAMAKEVATKSLMVMLEEMAKICPSTAENHVAEFFFVAFDLDAETVFGLDDPDFVCDFFVHIVVSPST